MDHIPAMRASRVLSKLRAGEIAICTKLNTSESRIAEIAALAGFDCLWLDTEHVANDWLTIEKQVLAAKSHGVDVVVRVERGSYSGYIRPLELDAAGIMVPHVVSAADAATIVRHTKFYPLGLRPLDGGNADGLFATMELAEYMEQANANRFNIMQIEDKEALDELDAIAALPGVDMLFFGPGDFTQSIGEPGNFAHPEVDRARKLVAERALAHGKFAGTVGSVGNFAELAGMGYRFISVGADVVGLAGYYAKLQSELTLRKTAIAQSLYGG